MTNEDQKYRKILLKTSLPETVENILHIYINTNTIYIMYILIYYIVHTYITTFIYQVTYILNPASYTIELIYYRNIDTLLLYIPTLYYNNKLLRPFTNIIF